MPVRYVNLAAADRRSFVVNTAVGFRLFTGFISCMGKKKVGTPV